MSSPVMVPVFAPDGSSGEVPQANLQDAIKAGAKLALPMTAPDGSSGLIPEDRVHDALQAGARLGAKDTSPSMLSLYKQALFNPVGSGAASGVSGGIEQIGGRAMQNVLAPVMHPWDTLTGAAHMIAHPINTAEQRVQEFRNEWQQNPALAVENAAGDMLGAVEGGRLASGAMSGVKPSPALGSLNNVLPALVERGIVPAAASGAAKALPAAAQATASKFVPSLVDGPPESLVTRAVKPGKNNVNWLADVQRALPLMKSAEQQLGRPVENIQDALDAAKLAKQSIWQQYQARLGPAATQSATIDGNQIADAMVNSIDRRTAVQNPGLVDKVGAIADTYRRPLSLTDAEDFLQSANSDLNTYYAKNKVGQHVALNDPETASTVAEAGALRKALYDKLDDISGPGAAYLKQSYGSLTNVEKEMYGRKLIADRQQPESLQEQLSTVRGAGKIIKGVATFDPGDVVEGAQNIAVSRAIKARNTTDAMLTRAFASAKPAAPFPAPSFRPPLGTARQLPATSSAPTILPYNPQMTGGENLAAILHYLRNTPAPLALPAEASPIPLPPSVGR